MISIHAHAIRTSWLYEVAPHPSLRNVERFRALVLSAINDLIGEDLHAFTPILSAINQAAAQSDSLSRLAIQDITTMVNSLPILRRRSDDGDAEPNIQVLLLDGFGKQALALANGLSHMAVAVKLVRNATEILDQVRDGGPVPRVVIVGPEILVPGEVDAFESALAAIGALGVDAPAVVVAADYQLTFAERLSATRLGHVRLFKAEDEVRTIRDYIISQTSDATLAGARVLLIDDSPTDAYRAASYMRAEGLVVEHIQDPTLALEAINSFEPNLIVTDYHMPVANGDVIASLIRQDPEMTMPIIYLSSVSDSEKQLMAISHGADGFVTKPLQKGAFIKAVKSMISRSKSIDRRMRRDPLTCLLNRGEVLESAKKLVGEGKTGSLAVIDIDHFKSVNDTYGHPVGDLVLIGMAEVLTAALRESDLIGRVGGEEFAIVLPGTEPAMAMQVMDRVRSAFSNVQHKASGSSFACTFSCGVAELKSGAAQALQQADEALYMAKRGGRNQVVIFTEVENQA